MRRSFFNEVLQVVVTIPYLHSTKVHIVGDGFIQPMREKKKKRTKTERSMIRAVIRSQAAAAFGSEVRQRSGNSAIRFLRLVREFLGDFNARMNQSRRAAKHAVFLLGSRSLHRRERTSQSFFDNRPSPRRFQFRT